MHLDALLSPTLPVSQAVDVKVADVTLAKDFVSLIRCPRFHQHSDFLPIRYIPYIDRQLSGLVKPTDFVVHVN